MAGLGELAPALSHAGKDMTEQRALGLAPVPEQRLRQRRAAAQDRQRVLGPVAGGRRRATSTALGSPSSSSGSAHAVASRTSCVSTPARAAISVASWTAGEPVSANAVSAPTHHRGVP
jgi:hypothetical protein